MPTDFVAWCGVVLRSLLAAQKSSPDAAMVGLRIDQLARAVFGDDEDIDALLHASDRGRALVDAYRELRGLGLIEDVAGNHLRVPRQQRDAVHDQGDLWRGICARSLDPDEERVLRALNRASEQPRDGYAFLKPVPYAELSAALAVADEDEATDRVDRIVGDLKAVGFVRRSGGQGNLSVVATYAGLAWETRRWDLEEDERLATSRSMMVDPIWSGRGVAIDERLCFVLMPFRPPFDEIYADHIKPTVERLPLDSRRADDIYGVRPIMEDIWEQLCRSRVVVADLTGRNPNVFYEVGIAHTLGKPVVLIAQSMDDVPFDLRHHRVIVYGYTPPGARKLEEALERTLRSVVSIPAAS